ncbi:LytTR family DNA-binding domain-containing protein [Pedobacter sp. L105]|uniref:LytR/AlgR family response regulator transcription factor n=1 Tax=Pedobacter sp. L105 TaxID=1641871 RepID=UPI00131C5C2B|nr:LytTR family DNA-binding domain-containing protein [Pedobacter sp. L105]
MSCIVIDDEPHAIEELGELIGQVPHLTLMQSFPDAKQAIAYLQETGHADIIFSDISMSVLNGIDAAEILNNYCHFLVYVTAYREYAPEAFEAKADGYLLKPVSYLSFRQKIEDLTNKFQDIIRLQKDEHQFLFIKGGQKSSYIKIKYSDIVYIEAMLNYIMIHTTTGHEITYIGLKAMEDMLQSKDIFFRINKSIIISLNYLDRVDGNIARLANGQSYQVGEKYKSVFLEFLKKHTLRP